MLKPRCLTNRGKSDLCFDWRHLRKQRPAFDKVISGLSIYSDEPIGCYYFLYGHNLLCGHSVWDIISLIASSVQHHGSAENSPEAAGVTFEKCSPLQFHFFQLDCLSIESSKTSILCWTRSRTHIMGHVYWWNSGLSPSYGLLTSPKVCCHFIICLSGLHMSEGCFLWKEVRVLLLFSGGASQIPS